MTEPKGGTKEYGDFLVHIYIYLYKTFAICLLTIFLVLHLSDFYTFSFRICATTIYWVAFIKNMAE